MKRLLLLAAFFALSTICSNAQKPLEFGEVTMEEMTMAGYDRDTSASALIVFDRGSCTLNDKAEVIYKRHIRIKFFTAEAIDEYATETILIHRETQAISRIRGVSYNLENGQITQSKLNDEGIYKTREAKIFDRYSFTIPNVRPGSVIEYSYTIRFDLALLPDWEFQHSIPTLVSEYEMLAPSKFTVRRSLQGFLAMSNVSQNSDGTRSKWIMLDAPAFKPEPYITTPSDYISRMTFYIGEVFIPGYNVFNLRRTWEQIAKALYDNPGFGGQVRASGYLTKIVEPIIAGANTPEERMKKIYDFVKQNISWDETVDLWPDRPFRKLIDEKKGTAAEINMLLVSMMLKADLEAYPVVLSTRDNGSLRGFHPNVGQFNTVLCLVKLNSKNILLDGTDPNLPYTALPERYLNGNGLVITGNTDKEPAEWIPLTSAKARTVYNTDVTIDPSGEITGKFAIAKDGLSGGTMRKMYADMGKEKYIEATLNKREWEVASSEFRNMEMTSAPASENYEVTIRDHVQNAGDVMYFNPYLDGRMEENIFKSEKREYPVDFATPFDVFHLTKFKIPEGYKIEEVPAQKIISMPNGLGKFLYNITVNGSELNLSSQLTISKSMVLPTDYPALREFYSQVIAKQAEQIVLKKVN